MHHATAPHVTDLAPGRSLRLSGTDQCWVQVERSGDGATLRWVRITRTATGTRSTVFHRERA